MSDVVRRLQDTLSNKADVQGIEFGGVWSTWGEVARYGDAIETALVESGVPAGARVAVVVRNRDVHASAIIGALAHNRSVSFIYAFLPAAAMDAAVRDIPAAGILAADDDVAAIEALCAETGRAVIALGSIKSGPSKKLKADPAKTSALNDNAPAEAGVEVLSSGTTGTPKRILMPMRLLERAVGSAPGSEAGGEPPAMINTWPLGGVGGVCLLTAAAYHGVPLVLIERFNVPELIDIIARHKPPTIGLPPAAIRMVYDANVPKEALGTVASISGGSAPIDNDLHDNFEKRYGIPLLWGLGATEFCGTIARWTPQDYAEFGPRKRGSAGRAMTGVELRIVDPETFQEMPAGQEGLMEVYCPAVRPDWVRTTDLAFIDEDGFLFHRGRYDGAIVRGGFKILPERVAEVLRTHPSVGDAVVVGKEDARLGMVPVAAVELRPGAPVVDAATLEQHARAHLAPTHVPAEIKILDALPRTPSMKVNLAAVKTLF